MIEIQSVGLRFGLATQYESLQPASSPSVDARLSSLRSSVKESLDFWHTDYGEYHPLVMPNGILTPWQILSLALNGYETTSVVGMTKIPFVVPVDVLDNDTEYRKWYLGMATSQSPAELPKSLETDLTNGNVKYYGQNALSEKDGFDGEGVYCVVILGLIADKQRLDGEGKLAYVVSEPFSFSKDITAFTEFSFKNDATDLRIGGSVPVSFSKGFHLKMFLPSQIGRPEYIFEETVAERYGYKFVEQITSKKAFRITFPATESMCDTLRIARLCQKRQMICRGRIYSIIALDMSVEWLEQGNIASVTLTFEEDNIINTVGEYALEETDGDFNEHDFNSDYYNIIDEQ